MLYSPLFAILTLALSVSANDAVHANPSDVDIGLTEHGSDWLWTVFAIMLASDLGFIVWHWRLTRGQRVFHQLPILILTTAMVAYFSMASNLGAAGIETEFRTKGTRAIWYVRYIYWVITTPLLLLELVLATALPLSEVVTLVFFQIALIVARMLGTLVTSSYKWGYYTLNLFFTFYVIWLLLGPNRTTASVLNQDLRAPYTRGAAYLSVLWLIYSICWALAEGSNTISVTGEMVFYGVLDILANPVFLFYHVHELGRVPFDSYGFTPLHKGVNDTHTHTQDEKRGLAGNAGTVPMSGQNTGTTNGAGAPPPTHAKGDISETV